MEEVTLVVGSILEGHRVVEDVGIDHENKSLTLLCFAAAWGLAEVIPEGFAFLIVAAVVGIVAAVMVVLGRKRLEAAREVAPETVETLKEDAQWTRQQIR